MQTITVNPEGLRCDLAEEPIVSLYSVVVVMPHTGMRTVYVLATDEKGASNQARCATKTQNYQCEKEIADAVKTIVTKLPLHVEGWGGNTY